MDDFTQILRYVCDVIIDGRTTFSRHTGTYVGKFSQHLVVLLPKEKCIWVSSSCNVMTCAYIQFYSDTAYRTRIQLAVLEHNAHVKSKHSQSLDYQYHRRYRKQTKNWDAVKVMEGVLRLRFCASIFPWLSKSIS